MAGLTRALALAARLGCGLAVGLSFGLAGCAPGAVIDQLPAGVGGLPNDAPARPAAPYQYPAVHDMPAARTTAPMSIDEQVRLEKELQVARDRLEGKSDPDQEASSTRKKPVPGAKNRPLDIKNGQASGAARKP
ncbi:MAG: hypothetical protein K9G60_16960 [Pseudolabrys sp.]|nr:hypothetical protein [Pseudolabrys sp.]